MHIFRCDTVEVESGFQLVQDIVASQHNLHVAADDGVAVAVAVAQMEVDACITSDDRLQLLLCKMVINSKTKVIVCACAVLVTASCESFAATCLILIDIKILQQVKTVARHALQ